MKRVLKISSRIFGIVLLLVLVLWMGIALYVNYNKQALLASITNQLNENINGTLTVQSMEPTLVKGFPAISVSLNNVLLQDTLYPRHHHNLLEAKSMSITVNAFSILQGAPRIRDVHIEDGNVYLFTDSFGYSNTNIFASKEVRDSSGKRPSPKLNHFFFDNVRFVFEHKANKKLFSFDIDHLEGRFDYNSDGWKAFLNVNMLVKAMDFYNPNGPFLKNKHVKANLTASFNKDNGMLNVPLKEIEVEGDDIEVGATVFLKQTPVAFNIEFKADNIDFQRGRSLLSTHIQGKLSPVNLRKPLSIQVSVKGKDQKGDQPVVLAKWQVKNNILEGQGAVVTDCNFTGYFHNQVNKSMRVCDENSVIAVDHMDGVWENIEFTADSIRVDNLVSPVLAGHFKSNFDLSKLNPILDNKSLRLDKGSVALDLIFKGGIQGNDTTQPFINGDVSIKNATINYTPRNLAFINTNAELNFRGSDLFIKNVHLQNGNNELVMEGTMLNLLNFYYTEPEKILLDWHIKSPLINLNQYNSFLEVRNKSVVTTASKAKQSKSISRLSNQLDQVLDKSSVQMKLNVGKIIYQKFTASNIVASVMLNQQGIQLENVSVQHAGGKLQLKGKINQNGPVNQFAVNASVESVEVEKFLAAFGNFGQATVTDKNIMGSFFLQADLTGAIKDNGTLVPSSMNGTAVYELKNGNLVDFAPLKNVGRFVFPRRDFSNIKILSLKNKLDIKGDKIFIHPLKLSSDAINADIEGTYAFGTGTDINVDIPLRNPKNDELLLNDSLKQEKRNKGLVVHLNVADNEDGKMKIRLVGKAIPQDGTQPAGKRKRKNLLGF